MNVQTVNIPLSKIEINKGQIKGVPANPRIIKDGKYKALVKSIKDDPEMMNLRELLVYEHEGAFVLIGGNMRYRALKELKYKEAPCKIIPADTSVEKLKAYLIKDNNGFGEWDWDMLANDWDSDELRDWGVDMPFSLDENTGIEEVKSANVNLDDNWFINIQLENESECQKLYNKLLTEGYECKIIH